MMSRKDYNAIATLLNSEVRIFKAYVDRQQCNAGNVLDRITAALADHMESDNPNFDRDRFVKACYGEK
jgi:hypothetical protein